MQKITSVPDPLLSHLEVFIDKQRQFSYLKKNTMLEKVITEKCQDLTVLTVFN